MTQSTTTLAVFDFDDTLINGDALWPFLAYVAGAVDFTEACIEIFASLAWKRFIHAPEAQDIGTFTKTAFAQKLLAGKRVEQLTPALEKLSRWQTWNEPMRQALLEHAAKGHHIVIASGSLDLYMPHLIKDLPHNALICTAIGVADGVITGELSIGNCVKERKAELVKEYIVRHGPFDDSWGYGNFPPDVPMLKLLKQQILV